MYFITANYTMHFLSAHRTFLFTYSTYVQRDVPRSLSPCAAFSASQRLPGHPGMRAAQPSEGGVPSLRRSGAISGGCESCPERGKRLGGARGFVNAWRPGFPRVAGSPCQVLHAREGENAYYGGT